MTKNFLLHFGGGNARVSVPLVDTCLGVGTSLWFYIAILCDLWHAFILFAFSSDKLVLRFLALYIIEERYLSSHISCLTDAES